LPLKARLIISSDGESFRVAVDMKGSARHIDDRKLIAATVTLDFFHENRKTTPVGNPRTNKNARPGSNRSSSPTIEITPTTPRKAERDNNARL
jgi:hypothetical protein